MSRGFNPYVVRANRSAIAHSIARSLRDGSYRPRPPAGFEVAKPSGGHRVVSMFEIADEVVSNRVLRSLTRKNLPKISSRAYAYRPDLTPHDAIAHVREEFEQSHRLFIAEYDFSKFFDTVAHSYLREALERMQFTVSRTERVVLEAFLSAPLPRVAGHSSTLKYRDGVGIPQGTSVSLFLANVAASELDRNLDRLGVGFARYADDTLIWSRDYGRISEAAEILHEASDRIGSPINMTKSEGIRLLVPDGTVHAEIRHTKSIAFLGHELTLSSASMKEQTVARLKARVQRLIYSNLLREPLAGTQEPSRVTWIDNDYQVLILQLRRYLYGSLSEHDVVRFKAGAVPPMSFEGVMSYFPLIDDEEQLEAIDNWILSQVWMALRARARLLRALGLRTPRPHGLSQRRLRTFQTTSPTSGSARDLRIPSVSAMSLVIRSAVDRYGIGVVGRRGPFYTYASATS